MGILDTAIMLCKYAASPRRTGAVCPSSKYLARRMVASIGASPSECGVVVELGAGTGAITRYIIEGGYAGKSKLFCIEFDKKLCALLSQKYPEANIINGSAENIRALVCRGNACKTLLGKWRKLFRTAADLCSLPTI